MRLLLLLGGFTLSTASLAVDRIVIDKSARTHDLIEQGRTVRSYRNIKLGDAPAGGSVSRAGRRKRP